MEEPLLNAFLRFSDSLIEFETAEEKTNEVITEHIASHIDPYPAVLAGFAALIKGAKASNNIGTEELTIIEVIEGRIDSVLFSSDRASYPLTKEKPTG